MKNDTPTDRRREEGLQSAEGGQVRRINDGSRCSAAAAQKIGRFGGRVRGTREEDEKGGDGRMNQWERRREA